MRDFKMWFVVISILISGDKLLVLKLLSPVVGFQLNSVIRELLLQLGGYSVNGDIWCIQLLIEAYVSNALMKTSCLRPFFSRKSRWFSNYSWKKKRDQFGNLVKTVAFSISFPDSLPWCYVIYISPSHRETWLFFLLMQSPFHPRALFEGDSLRIHFWVRNAGGRGEGSN